MHTYICFNLCSPIKNLLKNQTLVPKLPIYSKMAYIITHTFWERYVDDICTAILSDFISEFRHHSNSIELGIHPVYE